MSARAMTCLAALALLCLPGSGAATPAAPLAPAGLPAHLPRYRLAIDLDLARHVAHVRMDATWINPASEPTDRLVFNAHSRYVVPGDQIGFTAKMLEILRMTPSDAMGTKEPPLVVEAITHAGKSVNFAYEGETKTTLVVPLPKPVRSGESVTVTLDMTMHLPPKQGRWGQWEGVTCLSNWLPVFAYYGGAPPSPQERQPASGKNEARSASEVDWRPTPFIPWHQPFFNESGIYHATVRFPLGQHLGSSGTIKNVVTVSDGCQQAEIEAVGVRDFTLLCSARYKIHEGMVNAGPGGGGVRVHILAFEEHDFYAKHMMRIAVEALEKYSKWFGPYPWADFTIAEAFFGWNGNECSTLVMIDQRVFAMPHVAVSYVEYLVSHEICHQWWYNLIGTNGHCETWMDEGMANYFAHRLLNQKLGRNNNLMKYPDGLGWLPNIRREDYRSAGMYSTYAKGEATPIIQPMDKFGHLANLFNLCYDKGGRVVGMIEQRLGEAAFLDFIRCVVKKYRYRILRVEDFRRELDEHTGLSWSEFFDEWLYGKGMSDWSVEKVELEKAPKCFTERCLPCRLKRQLLLCRGACPEDEPIPPGGCRLTVCLHQRAEINEPTVLGIALPGCEGYPVRIQILPVAGEYRVDEPPAKVTALPPGPKGGARLKVELILPGEPSQVAVDPDQVLVDAEPDNNYWHTPVRWRVTPLYSFLEETDLTNAYDRWNLIFGPWLFAPPYQDSWFTRSTMVGLRAGAYRTQQFVGGAYVGYRTDWRDVVTGIDGMWDHWPGGHWQTGFIAEQRLAEFNQGDTDAFRGVLWLRHIFTYGASLYLPPIHYLEGFAQYSDNFLPYPTQSLPTGDRYDRTTTLGLHYRINYLTPYWDPEGGFQFDAWYEGGMAQLPATVGLQKLSGQLSLVKTPPNLAGHVGDQPRLRHVLEWLADWKIAMRAYGATAAPSRGEFFTMGGSDLFRGFDMAQRQGSTVWVGSVEARIPIARRLNVTAVDHVIGLNNAYLAGFYDVGNAYASGNRVGPLAHGVGCGLRLDVSWFSFVERTTLRLDVAKSLTTDTGVQVWVGINQPF